MATTLKVKVLLLLLITTLSVAMLLMLGNESKLSAAAADKVCQDKNSTCFTYAGSSWKKVSNNRASGDTYRVSSSKTNAALFFAASGPDIEFVTSTGPKRGTAKVLVVNLANGDVVRSIKYDLKTSRTRFKVVKKISGLGPDIPYGLAVASANGRPVVVDAINYIEGPPALPPHVSAEEAPPPPPPGSGGCMGTYDGDQPPPPPPGDGELPPPLPEC